MSLFLIKGYDSEVFKTPRSVLYAFEDTRYVLIEAFLWDVCLFGRRSFKTFLHGWNILPLKKKKVYSKDFLDYNVAKRACVTIPVSRATKHVEHNRILLTSMMAMNNSRVHNKNSWLLSRPSRLFLWTGLLILKWTDSVRLYRIYTHYQLSHSEPECTYTKNHC